MGFMLPQMMMQQMFQNQQMGSQQGMGNQQQQLQVEQCPSCGSLNFKGSKFCANCGTKLGEKEEKK
jgi:uncharacterized OB-fold protein